MTILLRFAKSLSVLVLLCADLSFAFTSSRAGTSSSTWRILGQRSTSQSLSSQLVLRAGPVPNPLNKLPWNVRKEKEREARRLKQERVSLHRQLGIAEDADYEEITEATNALIARAGSDVKARVKIEMAKDRILQIRLNERLAGLVEVSKDARAQSNYEIEGVDEDDMPQVEKEWNAPSWTRGLVVKPDEMHLKKQLRLWGIITLIGISLPPVQEYLGRFTWLFCVAQLTFRGLPQEETESGGMGYTFNRAGGGGGHRKVAFGLGVLTWAVASFIAYGFLPSWARGRRWTGSLAFTIQNSIFCLVSLYLQPYKGK